MVSNASPYLTVRSDEIEGILQHYDPYICGLAQRTIPRYCIHSFSCRGDMTLYVDELAQRSRIKFWQALRDRPIASPEGYIRSIVHNECVDLIRQRRLSGPLYVDEDGELRQESIFPVVSEESNNPESILVQQERVTERLEKFIGIVQQLLPERQQQAILCSMKDNVDDIGAFEDTLVKHQIDLEGVQWPKEKKEKRTWQASASIARRIIAKHMNIDISMYRRPKLAM